MSNKSKTSGDEISLDTIFSPDTPSISSATQHDNNYRPHRPSTQISPFDPALSTGYKYQDPSKFLTPTGHKLPHAYKFWFFKRGVSHSFTTQDEYLNSLTSVGPFDTVEEFWKIYSYIRRPTVPYNYVIHCFRADISPTWECDGNKNGGNWLIQKLRNGRAAPLFEASLLSMIGDEFNLGDDLCGIVLTVRKYDETIAYWNKDGSDQQKIDRMSYAIRKMTGLLQHNLRYSLHNNRVKVKQATNDTTKSDASSTDAVITEAVENVDKVTL